ncbi:hypothetical protein GGR52DRAFT_196120 [Hypoxylon sp. FL1284]|nr:hypothetical protein GGR52DRAFT_196120 [Hypoxylon sp. FL1284]
MLPFFYYLCPYYVYLGKDVIATCACITYLVCEVLRHRLFPNFFFYFFIFYFFIFYFLFFIFYFLFFIFYFLFFIFYFLFFIFYFLFFIFYFLFFIFYFLFYYSPFLFFLTLTTIPFPMRCSPRTATQTITADLFQQAPNGTRSKLPKLQREREQARSTHGTYDCPGIGSGDDPISHFGGRSSIISCPGASSYTDASIGKYFIISQRTRISVTSLSASHVALIFLVESAHPLTTYLHSTSAAATKEAIITICTQHTHVSASASHAARPISHSLSLLVNPHYFTTTTHYPSDLASLARYSFYEYPPYTFFFPPMHLIGLEAANGGEPR